VREKMKKFFLLLVFSGIVAAQDKILWKEDFSRFPDGFRPGCYHNGKGEVGVEDGRHYYRFPGGFMLGGGWNYFGARNWRNYILRFQLRPRGRFTLFLVVKREGWREKFSYIWYYVTISSNQVTVNAHNLTGTKESLPAEKIEPALEENRWYDFQIQVTENRIQVYLMREKEKTPVWDNEVLPGGGGIDFHGIGSFDLAGIEVEELE